MAEKFTCAHCGGTFDKAWSDEEAMAEAEGAFGDALGDDLDVVCDECYQRMTRAVPVWDWLAELRQLAAG